MYSCTSAPFNADNLVRHKETLELDWNPLKRTISKAGDHVHRFNVQVTDYLACYIKLPKPARIS